MNKKIIFSAILEKNLAGEDAVLVTIVSEIGSSPRSAGSHMLVNKQGRVCGTIGGGMLEYKSIQYAQSLFEPRCSGRKTYRLHRNDEEELGMICGGDVDVFFQLIRGGDETTITFMKDCLAAMERDEDSWLFIDLTDPNDWAMALYGTNIPLSGMELDEADIRTLARNRGILIKTEGRCLYGEPINFAGRVFIFGGGHCAKALEPVLTTVGFRCVVFDNREEYVSRELFPGACELITGDYEQIDQSIDVTLNDYIVILTHGWDLAVLRQVISKKCAYIGVIGSKIKIATVKQQLKSEGVGDEFLNKINAPIGLQIHSETPEEIAISIAGEMILRRAEQRTWQYGNIQG